MEARRVVDADGGLCAGGDLKSTLNKAMYR